MRLTLNFINDIYEYLNRTNKQLPLKFDRLIYDTRYTPTILVDYIKENGLGDCMWKDGMSCYQIIFEEIIDYQDKISCWSNLICSSEDINERYPQGNYCYYLGYVANEIPFIYHDCIDGFYFHPTRLSMFTPDYEIFISVDNVKIKVLPVGNRDMFFHKNFDDSLLEVKNYLKNTDRPIISDEKYIKE